MKKIMRRLCIIGDIDISNQNLKSEAVEFAKSMVLNNIGLVYTGYSTSLIKQMVQTLIKRNGNITFVSLTFNNNLKQNTNKCNKYYEIRDIHEYKMLLFNISDGFVILPSGTRVLEIVMEYLTWMQRVSNPKPVYIVNTDGFWTPLIKMFSHMAQEHFLTNNFNNRYVLINDMKTILQNFKNHL